jgi:hypothetical protein
MGFKSGLAALFLLVAAACCAAGWPEKTDTTVENRLALWLLEKGAKLVRSVDLAVLQATFVGCRL